MALRVGLRRASRLFAHDSFLRVASATDINITKSHTAFTTRRACFETSKSRFSNSTTSTSNLSHFRSFCSGKDIDSNRSSISTAGQETKAEDDEQQEISKPSKRHDLAMLFTCKVCETRSAKTMSRVTYETGIVIVRCPECRNLHLIADRLGWFGEKGSVEDFLEQQGVSVRKGLEGSYEFSVDDLAGWTPPSSESKS